jgi:hypothetical protein
LIGGAVRYGRVGCWLIGGTVGSDGRVGCWLIGGAVGSIGRRLGVGCVGVDWWRRGEDASVDRGCWCGRRRLTLMAAAGGMRRG